jgi:hypothetical protein
MFHPHLNKSVWRDARKEYRGLPASCKAQLGILAHRHFHERDAHIVFDEEPHDYYVRGSKDGLISVTTLLHHFAHIFNADKAIKSMRKGKEFNSEHYCWGLTDQEIKELWAKGGDIASRLGTVFHEAAEDFYNYEYWQRDALLGKDAVLRFPSPLSEIIWEYLHEPRQTSPEYNQFLMFNKQWVRGDISNKILEPVAHSVWGACNFGGARYGAQARGPLIPFRSEWILWDQDLKLAGTIDMLFCRRAPDGTLELVMVDWKRSKKIKFQNTFNNCYSPLHLYPDTNYTMYCLQLNVYRALIQRYYKLPVVEMYLGVFHPLQKTTYQVVDVPLMEKEVTAIFHARLQEVQKQQNSSHPLNIQQKPQKQAKGDHTTEKIYQDIQKREKRKDAAKQQQDRWKRKNAAKIQQNIWKWRKVGVDKRISSST